MPSYCHPASVSDSAALFFRPYPQLRLDSLLLVAIPSRAVAAPIIKLPTSSSGLECFCLPWVPARSSLAASAFSRLEAAHSPALKHTVSDRGLGPNSIIK